MSTKMLLKYVMALAVLSSSLIVVSSVKALPDRVPNQPCGTLSNPQPGTLCYSITPGGGKVSARGGSKTFRTTIQRTEPEYVIADIVIETTSAAGDKSGPTVNQISPGGTISVVSESVDKLRELKQLKADLQGKITALTGPALIEAQQKLSALSEEERIYEERVKATIEAGHDAGKFSVEASARSRSCGLLGTDTCGSWVNYNIYVIKRYVGDPIAAYNRALVVAQDAQNTINRLLQPNPQPNSSTACVDVNSKSGWTRYSLQGSYTRVVSISGGWSVDARSYAPVGAEGHNGRDAESLAPYNQYKFDQRFPFGALLMSSGQDVLWIRDSSSVSSPPFGAIDLRINDSDSALNDNNGSLRVCFGN